MNKPKEIKLPVRGQRTKNSRKKKNGGKKRK